MYKVCSVALVTKLKKFLSFIMTVLQILKKVCCVQWAWSKTQNRLQQIFAQRSTTHW